MLYFKYNLNRRRMNTEFLEEKVVILKPNPRGGGMISDKKHVGYFRYNGTTENFMLPRDDRNGGLIEVFKSDEEREFFAKKLGIKPEKLNVRAKDNYFYSFQIRVLKDDSFMTHGMALDLSDVMDMLKYKVLIKSRKISPTIEERYNTGEYVYYFVEKDHKDKTDLSRIELNAKVWEKYGEMKNSSDKMREFLFLYWIRNKNATKPPKNPTLDFCKIQIDRIIENDKKGFLSVFTSPNIKDEMLVYMGIENGLIDYDGRIFLNSEKQQIGKTIQDVIYHYNDTRNSKEKLKLKANIREITKNNKED